MAAKSTLSFSFAKKAEPKRVVEALKTKKDDRREVIVSLEGGEVKIDGPAKAASLLTIPCKNLLEEKRQAAKAQVKTPQPPLADVGTQGGLVTRNLSALSAEDAEAAKELLKDAAEGKTADDAAAAPAVAPILMREGSRRVREGGAAEATKDMYENVPVEAFGEAMLRGMGYDPDKHKTRPVFHDKIRDTHLGLGAAPLLPSEKLAQRARAAAGAGGKKAAAPKAAAAGAAAQAPADAAAGGAAADGERAAKRPRASDAWPSRGLVVRVVGDEPRLKDFFGAEAVVLEADATAMTCRIKARAGGQSHVLPDVPVRSLETRVSGQCKEVRVVRGPRRGAVAKLLQRDVQRGVAKVSLAGAEEELPLDEVCQFMA